jgi:hypothetical protein
VTDKEENTFVQNPGWPTLSVKWKTRSRTNLTVCGKPNIPSALSAQDEVVDIGAVSCQLCRIGHV